MAKATAMWMIRAAWMSDMPRRRMLTLAIVAVCALESQNCFATDTQLLSLSGIHLHPLGKGGRDEANYIAAFDIRTWDVEVLAVCHIPGGWTISAGKNANPDGVLSGSAGEGVAFIDAAALGELNNLFLVKVTDYHAEDRGDCGHNCTPATFSGNLDVGTYSGAGVPDTKLRLSSTNISLTPATKCPDPW